MRETKDLEFKESVSNTFLKTVSAYANYGSGIILFGVTDDGTKIGTENPNKTCLDIENKINDNISPVPEYSMEIDNETSVITLSVREGIHKPYLYKSKAYRRNDSASIEVDRLELTRLILEGSNLSFEELPAKSKVLEFNALSEKLRQTLHLQDVTLDTLKTLKLYEGEQFNIAGELLADQNSFCGIDAVRFGDSINIILDRETFEKESLLLQYDHALEIYHKYYQYEQIRGSLREAVSLIPEEAYREAIANALVHRTWDVNTHITLAMFPDRIEITSPGGLPNGMHEDEYYQGGISIPRNRIIANTFLRLNMIERFGTGIRRINESYQNSERKPVFNVNEHSIKVTLPVFQKQNDLSPDENRVYTLLKGKRLSSSAIANAAGLGKTKTISILKKLADEGYIRKSGNGRGLKYYID